MVKCPGAEVWWWFHFLMVQKLNQVYFNKMLQRLVVAGAQLGFFYIGGFRTKDQTICLKKVSIGQRVETSGVTCTRITDRDPGVEP